jgi:predicted glycosyltransferase involved in capsule biosynthesis
MVGKNDTVAIGWCDNGTTDGKFVEGLTTALVAGPTNGMIINTSIRVQGNQIGRQRQNLFDYWADKLKTDWLLWVDSDIVLNLEAMKKLWQAADKINRPVVSGTYFISKENEGTLMRPFPCLFDDVSEHQIKYVHPLPDNQLIKVDNAGFGFVLMHKSIVPKMREAHPDKGMFMETGDGNDDHFIGEDIIFFRRMKAAGIPLHAHTGALVKHMKRFNVDFDYYALYWTNEHLKEQLKQQG